MSQTEKESKAAQLKADWQLRHDTVVAAGGLHIIGTERHESRRVITNCAAVLADKVTQVLAVFTWHWMTNCCVFSLAIVFLRLWSA